MRRIPEDEYGHRVTIGAYVTPRQIAEYHTKAEQERFGEWMYGQTCSCTESGETAIYAHDYERWLRQGKKKAQASHDWD